MRVILIAFSLLCITFSTTSSQEIGVMRQHLASAIKQMKHNYAKEDAARQIWLNVMNPIINKQRTPTAQTLDLAIKAAAAIKDQCSGYSAQNYLNYSNALSEPLSNTLFSALDNRSMACLIRWNFANGATITLEEALKQSNEEHFHQTNTLATKLSKKDLDYAKSLDKRWLSSLDQMLSSLQMSTNLADY